MRLKLENYLFDQRERPQGATGGRLLNPFLPGYAIVCNFVSSLPETQFKPFKVPHDPYNSIWDVSANF